ncbi:DBB domain-containing protein stumps isoform X1 [Dermacentor variabilis]|uniref:DBB domain-containing protein stumps isoform X1 n=2 Tax=Dermacentor variabilis TaxID=34621 RepID=UPI003F5B9C74
MTTADDAVRSGGSGGRCDPMHPASIAAAWLAQLADRCRELRHCARTLLVLPPCFDCYARSPDVCAKFAQGSAPADLSSPGREQSCVAASVGSWTALESPASALAGEVQGPRQAVIVEPVAGLRRCSASRETQTALGTVCTSCKARRPADGPLQLRLGMAADVSTLFCSDGREWGSYLTDCFRQQALTVTQEALDAISLPLPQDRAKALGAAKVSLLIVSPDLLELLERRGAELFSVGRLLEADRGLAMLCGVEPHELGSSLRAAFPNFSSWPLLEARNQDREFVIRLVETAREIVERADHSMGRGAGAGTPQFRLCPRKVHQGNTKVFAMLNEPVEQTQKFQVLFESSGMHELPVKWRNPYVLQFTVPETFLQVSKVVNVQLRCDGALLGVRQLKCESQMSQLHVLLQSATSPYEMLSLTLGLATLHDVDTALATNLHRNLPARGFHLLGPQQQVAPEKKRSEELLPTLLHFAAHYGLHELSLALLQCPGASACCQMLNCKGHSPAQLASNAGHHRLATTINEFQSRASTPAVEEDAPVLPPARVQSNPGRGSPPRMHYENVTVGGGHYASPGAARGAPVCNPSYGLAPPLPPPPAPEPPSADDDQEAEYLSMLPQVEAPPKGQSSATNQGDPDEEKKETSSTSGQTDQGTPDMVFSNTQEDLVRIIEMYKKGVPFSQIEKLFDDWKKNNENAKNIDDSNLQALRELYKQKQRAVQAAKQSFSLSDLRQIITGKGNRRGSRSRDIQHTTLPNMKQDDSTDGCRRVSTLSAVSTSSSGSSTSSDRLSTLSSMSAYDSGAHSDSCEEGRPPPRPPRLPAPRNPKAATHQYYAFAPGSGDRSAPHHHSPASPQAGNVAASTASEVRANSIPSSISLHGNMSTSAKPAVVNPSAGVYYDIPQVPRPVIDHRHNPLLDYDFPMAALRRVAPPPCPPEPDDGRHYYDIPKWGAGGAPLPATPSSKQQVRLSIPDIPAPPVPDD